MTIDELVGENVRRARVSAGLSAHELAHRVTGVGLPLTESALLRLEAGEDRLGVDELIAFGLALGMPPALLLAPMNLGSLLWVDAEGKPLASWALFHDNARSFSLPAGEPGPAARPPALETAPAGEPPPPPPIDEPEVITAPASLRDELMTPAGERLLSALDVEEAAAQAGPVLPPDPAPYHPPVAGLPEERPRSPHRDWALEALQTLQMLPRDP